MAIAKNVSRTIVMSKAKLCLFIALGDLIFYFLFFLILQLDGLVRAESENQN